MSEFNLDLASRVLDQIKLPGQHHQPDPVCCVVGWTIRLANSEEAQMVRDYAGHLEFGFYGMRKPEQAAVMLGVAPHVAETIWNTMNNGSARKQLVNLIEEEKRRRARAARTARRQAKADAKQAARVEEETQRAIDLQARAQVRAACKVERTATEKASL